MNSEFTAACKDCSRVIHLDYPFADWHFIDNAGGRYDYYCLPCAANHSEFFIDKEAP